MMKTGMKKIITEPTVLESADLTAFIAFRNNILPTDKEWLKLARALGVDPSGLDSELKSFVIADGAGGQREKKEVCHA